MSFLCLTARAAVLLTFYLHFFKFQEHFLPSRWPAEPTNSFPAADNPMTGHNNGVTVCFQGLAGGSPGKGRTGKAGYLPVSTNITVGNSAHFRKNSCCKGPVTAPVQGIRRPVNFFSGQVMVKILSQLGPGKLSYRILLNLLTPRKNNFPDACRAEKY